MDDATKKLRPNVKYRAGEFDYIYETDELGRISKFETDNLQLTTREQRLKHNPNTPGKQSGDHAGHLAGDRFGGSPDIDNLVSQSSDVKLRKYKKIENEWERAIKDGKKVEVKVDVKYEGEASRPTSFDIEYKIDGKEYKENILND